MEDQENWFLFERVQQVDTPSLVIYSERVAENIERVKKMVATVDLLRPHVKTIKSIDGIRLMLKHGIKKFKCATIAEAEMLGMCKSPDVLMAYQPTVQRLFRFIRIIKKYPETRFSFLVDNEMSAEIIHSCALEQNVNLSVFIDLNVGMGRTGILPNRGYDLFLKIMQLPGLEFKGVHAYDGHIRDKDLLERTQHCNRDFEAVEKLRKKMQSDLHFLPLLIAGGSPTFAIHSKRLNTECSPGTFILWDKGYHNTIPDQNFLFAALVLTRVISMPDETKICIDLGYKSISSENELDNRVFFLNAPYLKPLSHSEEHMVIEAGNGHGFKIGDILYALPIHICPTVAMYDFAHIVRDNAGKKKWPITARNRSISV